ncbi:hypothetical protein ABGB12_22055 [Actinocorallia sp. B10E7]|uniref:hypothetical protein n=1 Tax=Actinocorallia sp. B10E7 TaxID=3153558 RepID=UPI00325EA49B
MMITLDGHRPGVPFTTDGEPAVVLDVESRLMQNYRVAAPVHAGAECAAVRNRDGEVEFFTLGADNTIWHFRPDPSSESGYRQVSTGAQATTFGAGLDSEGRITLFAGDLLELSCLTEDPADGTWSAPARIAYPVPPSATRIEKIAVERIAGRLYVGMMVRFSAASRNSGDLFQLVYSVWDPARPVFQRAVKMNVDSVNCCWLGESADDAFFACVDGVIVGFDVASAEIRRIPVRAPFESFGVAAAPSTSADPRIFAVLGPDRGIHEFVPGSSKQPGTWRQVGTTGGFRQVLTALDGDGATHLFGVTGGNGLFHWRPDGTSPAGFTQGTLIASGIASATAPEGRGDTVDLSAVGTAQSTLTHLFLESVSTNWVQRKVEVSDQGRLEEYVSYSSDATVYGEGGVLLVNTPVTISVAERSILHVNGAVHSVAPDRPLHTSTNAAGMLSIAQETDSLAAPAIGVNVQDLMPASQTIVLEQSAGVRQRLAHVTGAELRDAKDADGAYLLGEDYRRHPKTADALAEALTSCMSLSGGVLHPVEPLPGRTRSNRGVGLLRGGTVGDTLRLSPPPEYRPWRLTFGSDEVSFDHLDRTQADGLPHEGAAPLPGLPSWVGDIGDFLSGVVNGFIRLGEITVTVVGDAVRATVKAAIDGIEYGFDAVIDTVEAAFDLAQMIFAGVKVGFQKLFEWLGFLFGWDDILRTKKAIAYTIRQFLGFAAGAVPGIRRMVDQGIADLQRQTDQVIDAAIARLGTNTTVDGIIKSNRHDVPTFTEAAANTVVFNAFIDNAAAAVALPGPAFPLDDGSIDDVLAQLTRFVDSTKDDKAFVDIQNWFATLGADPARALSALLSTLLRLAGQLAKLLLSGVQGVADALLELARTLLTTLQDVLDQPWDIPLVTPLYRQITKGSEPSALDLVALVIAVPGTVGYKLLHDEAPFADDAALAEFKACFTSRTLIQASGLGDPAETRTGTPSAAPPLLPEPYQALMKVCGAFAQVFWGTVSAVVDSVADEKDLENPLRLHLMIVAIEVSWQAMSCPWFFTDAVPDCSTPDGRSSSAWCFGWIGVFLDTVFVLAWKKIPENQSDAGVLIAFYYAACHLMVNMVGSVGYEASAYAANLFPVIPELSKILRLKGIIVDTGETSLAVLALIDVLCSVVGAGITFSSLASSRETAVRS